MAKATDQSKTGSVTVATVRAREEAQRIARHLEAAGISCILTAERDLDTPMTANRFKEIKVQVSRADAPRAVQLLRDKEMESGARPRGNEFFARRSGAGLSVDGWRQTALAIIAIIALAALLAAWLF
jgi:hypothetical protein